jgi:hypothetical protein
MMPVLASSGDCGGFVVGSETLRKSFLGLGSESEKRVVVVLMLEEELLGSWKDENDDGESRFFMELEVEARQ